MSAYVVEAETIDRIVTYNDKLRLRDEWLYLEPQKAAEVTPGQPHTLDALGISLFRMNVQAVNHCCHEQNPVPLYRYTYRWASPVQVYKSLQCYLYQCAEGDVPETPLCRRDHRRSARVQGRCLGIRGAFSPLLTRIRIPVTTLQPLYPVFFLLNNNGYRDNIRM